MTLTQGFTVVVLAGGLGTRLKDVVNDVPKPLAPILDKPFLDYLLAYWVKNNAKKIILSVGYKNQFIKKHFGSNYKGVPIEYVIEDVPAGTGGAVLKVLNEVNMPDDFFIINGDTLFLNNQKSMISSHVDNEADFTVCLRNIEDAGRYHRIQVDNTNKLCSILEPDNKKEPGLINGGVYIVNRKVFDGFSIEQGKTVSLENEILPELVPSNKVYGVVDHGAFIDIGIPDDYFRAESFLNENLLIDEGVS